MRILSFIFLLFYQFDAFSIEMKNALNLEITKEKYNSQVRPLLREIIEQYYSFIAASSPEFGKDLQDMQSLAVKIAIEWKDRSTNCKKDRANCDLSSLYREANSLDQLILGLQEKFWVGIKPKYDADTLIKVSKYLDEVMIINYKLLHKVEEIHVLSNNFNKPKPSSFDAIALIQRDQENNTINLLFNILPDKMKKDFMDLYYSFIKPLEHQASMPNAHDLIASKIHDYNITINVFNMNLTKGDIPISVDQANRLRSIHSSWNSMLRSLL
jgi:hypothetical protein